jgi:hypothetical protein
VIIFNIGAIRKDELGVIEKSNTGQAIQNACIDRSNLIAFDELFDSNQIIPFLLSPKRMTAGAPIKWFLQNDDDIAEASDRICIISICCYSLVNLINQTVVIASLIQINLMATKHVKSGKIILD